MTRKSRFAIEADPQSPLEGTRSEIRHGTERDEISEFVEWQERQYTEGVYAGGKLPPMGVMIAMGLATGSALALMGAGMLAFALTEPDRPWPDIALGLVLLGLGAGLLIGLGRRLRRQAGRRGR